MFGSGFSLPYHAQLSPGNARNLRAAELESLKLYGGGEVYSNQIKPTYYMFGDKFQPPECGKQGWLTKQGELHKNWKKRYFGLLDEGLLYYFNSEEAPKIEAKKHTTVKATGCIVLSWRDTCSRDSVRDKNGEYFIVINQSHRNWHLSTASEQNACEWVSAIQTVIEKLKAKAQATPKLPNSLKGLPTYSTAGDDTGTADAGASATSAAASSGVPSF
eukprot:TRINITY_DN15718_c0_g1_i1.p1 TRINITY_DN15718_c0_g1~~TRINITY_DN15718_c0_g1_i1.p1  ORF type:complete len:217 (-),score=47.25 TRINITY_DN15718_c0_g1_i1:50-700(-)